MTMCTHKKDTSYFSVDQIDLYGEPIDDHWVYSSESTQVDIDLHRYKCTKCGEIGYYSSRAREHHENGTSFDIRGLE